MNKVSLWAMQVGHAQNMVAELPRAIQDPAVPAVLYAAGLESYFINLRLLLEFYLDLSKDRKRIRSADFLPGWSPPRRADLKWVYGFASAHVAHLAKRRVPDDGAGTADVSFEQLTAYTAEVFAVAEMFVDASRAAGKEWADLFDGHLAEARRRARGPV